MVRLDNSRGGNAFTLTTVGTSGAATYTGGVLNIPNYSSVPALTSGSVIFSNGVTLAEDNANFFWNNTNKSLGIGTNSIQGKLNVVTGTSGVNATIANQALGSIVLGNISSSVATPTIIGKSNNDSGLYTVAATNDINSNPDYVFNARKNDNTDYTTLTSTAFLFSRFTTSLVSILRNGNTGINTTTPANRLSVIGNGTTTGLTIGGAATYEFALTSITGTPDSLVFKSVNINTNTTHLNNILVLQRSGNVGINVASPTAKLDVQETGTGLTTTWTGISGTNSGSTFNTTSTALTGYTGFFSNTATRAAGANTLTNIGVYGNATGGQTNYAFYADTGNVYVVNNITSPGAGSGSEKFGLGATAAGQDAVSIGRLASASQPQSTALGTSASATGLNSTAIGYGSLSSGGTSTAIGYSSEASGANSTAIGAGSAAKTSNNTAAFGYLASATGLRGTAIGTSSVASSNFTAALGGYSVASGAQSTAIGVSSSATFAGSIALGAEATTTAVNQLVIGGNNTNGTDFIGSVVIGSGVTSASPQPVTIGINSVATSVTDGSGALLVIAGSAGTGAGTPGSISFRTSDATTTGTTAQAFTTKATVTGAGLFGIGTVFNSVTTAARLHVLETTIGSDVFRIESVATGDDPGTRIRHAVVSTTDATATTLFTFAIPSTTAVRVHIEVLGRRTGGTSGTAEDCATYTIEGLYKNVAGTATLVGALQTLFSAEDQATWDATITTSAGNILVRVTGAANNNIRWHLSKFEYSQLSS